MIGTFIEVNNNNNKLQSKCKDIKREAFDSHNCCYTAGKECTKDNRPSICDIPCEDWFMVFWTIKETLTGDAAQVRLYFNIG